MEKENPYYLNLALREPVLLVGYELIKQICNVDNIEDAMEHGSEILDQIQCDEWFVLG